MLQGAETIRVGSVGVQGRYLSDRMMMVAGGAGAGAGKLQPTLAKRDPARGDTIVSLLYAAAAGDLDTLKTHHLLRHNMNAR